MQVGANKLLCDMIQAPVFLSWGQVIIHSLNRLINEIEVIKKAKERFVLINEGFDYMPYRQVSFD